MKRVKVLFDGACVRISKQMRQASSSPYLASNANSSARRDDIAAAGTGAGQLLMEETREHRANYLMPSRKLDPMANCHNNLQADQLLRREAGL